MLSSLVSHLKQPLFLKSGGALKLSERLLSTGIHQAALEDYNTLYPLLPVYHYEKEYIEASEWDLVIPTTNDVKEGLISWNERITRRIESVDYALLITNGLNRTKVIFSAVRLTASETPARSEDKLGPNSLSEAVNELSKKWSLIKQKLPAWQETIATQLQRLQDYINKKITADESDKKSCP